MAYGKFPSLRRALKEKFSIPLYLFRTSRRVGPFFSIRFLSCFMVLKSLLFSLLPWRRRMWRMLGLSGLCLDFVHRFQSSRVLETVTRSCTKLSIFPFHERKNSTDSGPIVGFLLCRAKSSYVGNLKNVILMNRGMSSRNGNDRFL